MSHKREEAFYVCEGCLCIAAQRYFDRVHVIVLFQLLAYHYAKLRRIQPLKNWIVFKRLFKETPDVRVCWCH